MMKKYKKALIISSIAILLPVLFGLLVWNQLPDSMVSHFGGDGVADGTAPKAFMVFGMPLILLAIHWLCVWSVTVLDKRNTQNHKMNLVALSIIPATSLVVHICIYGIALEKEWNVFVLFPLLLGGLFLVIGNYLPKTTRNRTAGIKLHWTMGNDENWNKTHRLGGRLYFWGGLAVIVSALFSIKVSIAILILVILVSVIVPAVYSYLIYRKHKAAGIKYEPVFNQKSDKVAIWITAVTVPLILIGVAIIMFTGNIEVQYGDTDFQILASYTDDISVQYDGVESVEYRETFEIGTREMGFGSPRLSTGTFQNEEFGRYTLYAYTQGEGAVVLRKGEKVLVIVGRTAGDTLEIYNTLAEKIK